ncbi:SCO family protein [Pedobacter sp. HMF7647]|uniref:SCO family protein n=1 Tax=Hufsiella arboris TaxID=2695275 RepID=A0A7K1YC44_9SPHI|nr:SCO family protein [Hufsiella arboris]MXV52156.1 SCO family protein [Hufsiella arboris]
MKYFGALIISLTAFISCTQPEKKLPILGNREPVEKTVDGKVVVDTVYQTIPSFNFINQDSVQVSDKNFAGKVYVADFFFTSCTSICPIMHRNMLKVYNQYKSNPEVKLLSHSIDSKYDTPSQLKKYADKLGVKGDMWEFVNGPHDAIYGIAEKSYLVSVAADSKDPANFIHQGWFVLVDKDKRLRGAYDGTDPKQVDQLTSDIQTLLDEYHTR